jgi:hypothetical protein
MDPIQSTNHDDGTTEEDLSPDLNNFLDEIRNAGMVVTNQWKCMWLAAFKYAWGQQLEDLKPKEGWKYVIINRIYPLMMQNIAKLAKNDPKINTFAWDNEEEGVPEYVEWWAKHLEYLWKSPYEMKMRQKLIMGILDAALMGYMVGKTYWEDKVRWDPKAKKWLGSAREKFIHPACFWCDPSADSMDEAENCGTFRRVKMEWAQNRWPDYKEQIEAAAFTEDDAKFASGNMIIYEDQKASTTSEEKRLKGNLLVDLVLNKGLNKTGNSAGSGAGEKQRYNDIEEIYWKDYEEKEVVINDNVPAKDLIDQGKVVLEEITGLYLDPETNEELKEWPTQKTNEYTEPLYPNGRFVLRIGRTILNPKIEDQKYKYSKWPFTVMPYYLLPHMWQGSNAVEMSRNNNDALNLTVSAMMHRVRLAADQETIVEAGALARDRKGKIRTTKFGISKIIIAAKGKIDRIRKMDYGNMEPATIALAQIMQQDIADSMFMQDVARGASKKGTQSATEAAKLDVNSHDNTALQAIFLDNFIDDTASLVAELCQANYEPGYIARAVSDDGQIITKIDQGALDVRFDVNVEPGSTLPFDIETRKRDHMEAYKIMGEAIANPMLPDMLRILNIPNREKLLERHQGNQLFIQFIQLSQQVAQIPPEEIQALAQTFPPIMPLYQLMMQAAQLAGGQQQQQQQ